MKRTLQYQTIRLGLASVLLMFLALPAHAGIWPELPVACLPERALPWQDNKSPEDQAPCHCPPLSYCPQSYEEYKGTAPTKMPKGFVRRCCPKIASPNFKCPDGKLASAGKCVIPKQCPLKNYSTLEQAGTFNGQSFTGTYKNPNAQSFAFNNDTWYGDYNYHVARLGEKYNFSLRVGSPGFWVWGPMFCEYYGDGAGIYGGGDFSRPRCAFKNGYAPLTDGYNNGYRSLIEVVGTLGPQNLTWFGFSVARPDRLPDNLVTENIFADIDDDIIEIANNSWQGSENITFDQDGFKADGSYRTYDVETISSLQQDRPELLQLCRNVQGEYLELEYKPVEEVSPTGQKTGKILQCPYLQCRYVYETTFESCLTGETKIALADGTTRTIDSLAIGDQIKTATGSAPITATNRYVTKKRVLYSINGSDFMITGDHPIRTTKGFKVISEKAATLYAQTAQFAAEPLKAGDTIVTLDGNIAVNAIRKKISAEAVATYNLKLDHNASFYANGIEVKSFDDMQIHYK